MELQLKNRILLCTAIAWALASCEDPLPQVEEDSADQRFRLSAEWNRIYGSREIVVQNDDYVVMAMADSHAGGTRNLDRFFTLAKTANVSAVLMAGDLTTGKSNDYDEFQKHLPAQDSLPTFMTVGNHDLWAEGWTDYYSRFGASSYLFTVKTPGPADLYISLDTGSGTLGNEQLNWLSNILQTRRDDYRFCIVFTHTNFFRTRHGMCSNPVVEELNVLMGLFARYKVNMVLTGHDHSRDIYQLGITNYITIGALSDEHSEPGYVQVNITKGNLTYEFKDLK